MSQKVTVNANATFTSQRNAITEDSMHNSLTPDLSLGDQQEISVTATATAFTINNPINIPNRAGTHWWLRIKNTSGGGMGAITFGGNYKLSTVTNPANTKGIVIPLIYDGTNHVLAGAVTPDTPN